MGSLTLLDLLSSIVVSSLLFLTALSMNERASSNTYAAQTALTVQQNMTSVVENLEWDFRLVGYCNSFTNATPSSEYIVSGDTNSIAFQADLNNDGVMDRVQWSLGTTPIPGCPNPNVRMLTRTTTINGVTKTYSSNLGVTVFHLTYFDAIGDTVYTPFTNPSTVQLIRVELRLEPVAAYADTANKQIFSSWMQTRLVSKNLNNR